jgi:hypothetical protein
MLLPDRPQETLFACLSNHLLGTIGEGQSFPGLQHDVFGKFFSLRAKFSWTTRVYLFKCYSRRPHIATAGILELGTLPYFHSSVCLTAAYI